MPARIGLNFADPAVEARFVAYYITKSLPVTRLFLVVGAISYYGFFISDKIKTIGGSYMAVGGMSRGEDGSDHAQNAAHFALAIQAEIQKMIAETGYLIALRVGLHIGPVFTGVVGVQRPSFDCWGEAVDLASGLEGRAPPGGILISESAYDRLKGTFATSSVRHIELKGVAGRNRVRLLLGQIANDQDAGAKQGADANA